MVTVSVTSVENGVTREESFDVDLEAMTVAVFRQEIAARLGWRSFNLFLKLAVGRRLLKINGDDEKILGSVGVVEGSVFPVFKGKTAVEHQQYRLEVGLTKTLRATRNVDRNVVALGEKVDAVADDLKVAVGILRGKAGPRPEGMSASARMEQNRVTVLMCQTENRELKKEIAATIEEKKIARSHAVTEAAQVAEGSVDVVVGGIVGENLEEKFEAHKAQGRILAVARRKEKAQERKAAAKAKVVAKPKGRKRCRIEADGEQETLDEHGGDVAGTVAAYDAAAIIAQEKKDPDQEMMDEEVTTASSSSSDAPALGA